MPFVASSKLLAKKWEERRHKQPLERLHGTRHSLDNKGPQPLSHLMVSLKKVQLDEERQASIDHNNKLLLGKLTDILRSQGRLDNWNHYEIKSLNRRRRRNQQEQIMLENVRIARALQHVKPYYHVEEWEHDFHHYKKLQEQWAKTTKDYEDIGSPKPPHNRKEQRDDTDYETSSAASSSFKLPPIDRKKGGSQGDGGSGGGTRLPPIKSKSSAGSSREIDKGQDPPEDLKLLFKAVKQMAKPEEVVLKTLIRKTHAQRLQTRSKFEDYYDLNLVAELKATLGHGFNVLIDSLLADKTSNEVVKVYRAIQGNEPAVMVQILATKNAAGVAALNKAKKKKVPTATLR